MPTVSIVTNEQITEPIAPVPEPSESIDWLAIKDQLNSNPITVSFETYKTEGVLGQASDNKLVEVIDYLENNPDGSIEVNGHADITGPRALNMKLGQERADFVKNYLVRGGIDANKVVSSSKGPMNRPPITVHLKEERKTEEQLSS